mmetsp:Transcript_5641/g.8662  ORF Transcript_5641/g.8662 Transcript_5641/m.8662 type:complete len:104 (+) Transcript_5641:1149-1460(+)
MPIFCASRMLTVPPLLANKQAGRLWVMAPLRSVLLTVNWMREAKYFSSDKSLPDWAPLPMTTMTLNKSQKVPLEVTLLSMTYCSTSWGLLGNQTNLLYNSRLR